MARQRPQGWERLFYPWRDDLEDCFRLLQVAQAVDTEVSEDHVGGEIVARELVHGLGEKDLATMGGGEQPREPIHR
jgi:hypothetical protein